LAHVWDFDKLKGRLVHGRAELLVTPPIAVGFLDHDAAFQQQALQHLGGIEFFIVCIPHTQGDILEITENRQPFAF